MGTWSKLRVRNGARGAATPAIWHNAPPTNPTWAQTCASAVAPAVVWHFAIYDCTTLCMNCLCAAICNETRARVPWEFPSGRVLI